MSVRWYTIVVDSHDTAAQGRWWAEVLDWQIAYEAEGECVVVPPYMLDESKTVPLAERGQGLVFVTVPEAKELKNRLHIDLAPYPDATQADEVDRLIGLGATRTDVGQSDDVGWVVLADPEGNEFCVLSPRD